MSLDFSFKLKKAKIDLESVHIFLKLNEAGSKEIFIIIGSRGQSLKPLIV